MAYQKGDIIDNYTLETQLGSGGFAEVWRVRDRYSQIWAMKIYASQTGLDSYGRTMFREEFEKTRNLRHTNVLHCVEFGESDGRPYLIMPLGKSSLRLEMQKRLQERRQSGQPPDEIFSEEEIAQILADLADGLGYLQQQGIIHQDIKPDNILLIEENSVSRYAIADFGVSTQLRTTIMRQTQALHKSSENIAAGYASPEQLEGHITKKSDIFSLGVLLFELATGKLPFEGAGIATGKAIRDGLTLPGIAGNYSLRLKRMIDACLELDPHGRPDTAQLLNWADGFLKQGFWSEGVEKIGHRSILRDPRLLAGAGVLLLLLALFFGWRANRTKKWQHQMDQAKTWFDAGEMKNAATAFDQANALRSDAETAKKKALADDLSKRYQHIGRFSDGLAVVRSGTSWGYIDAAGTEVIAPQYEQAGSFVNGHAAVFKDGNCGYITAKGDAPGGMVFKTCSTPVGSSATVQRQKGGAAEIISL